MNPESARTPQEETELRLTALLLGELSPEEAAALHAQMAADPALAALHGRLQRAAAVLREATALSEPPVSDTPPRLSAERREKLLASFKVPATEAARAFPREDWSWVWPLALAASLIVFIGGALLLPKSAEQVLSFSGLSDPRAPAGDLLGILQSSKRIDPPEAREAEVVEELQLSSDYLRQSGAASGSETENVLARQPAESTAPAAKMAWYAPAPGTPATTSAAAAPAPANRPAPAATPPPASDQRQLTVAGRVVNGAVDGLSWKESPPALFADSNRFAVTANQNRPEISTSTNLHFESDVARKNERGLVFENQGGFAVAESADQSGSAIGGARRRSDVQLGLEIGEPVSLSRHLAKQLELPGEKKPASVSSARDEGGAVAQQLADADGWSKLGKDRSGAPEPQPEIQTSANAISTFSLNVSDVAFKLASASLEQGKMPEVATVRSEEFINAFDYRDPEPGPGAPLAFVAEVARYPFAQNRDLLRLGVKTAAAGRQPGRPLNLVLLLDNSGSMERADRVRILREALRVLAAQLQPQDRLSVVTFARTPRLWADGVAGDQAGATLARIGEITPEGGTNLSAALDLGYATALRHYQAGSINRVVLLTDGAANLGDVQPATLQQKVESFRQQGVALDCFGIGWEGYDDAVLEALSRRGDGRYAFINTPEEAATGFAAQLAGALRVAASDVKVQVEFNPSRVTAYRQIGYAKHQLTAEQFRDNTVDAAEIGAAESGNALYVLEVNPRGTGDLGTVRVRFKVPGTAEYREQEWPVPFTPNVAPLEQASPALRLAATGAAFAEWLVASPYAGQVTPDRLLGLLQGVPASFGADPRPQKLEWMIRTAKSVSGR